MRPNVNIAALHWCQPSAKWAINSSGAWAFRNWLDKLRQPRTECIKLLTIKKAARTNPRTIRSEVIAQSAPSENFASSTVCVSLLLPPQDGPINRCDRSAAGQRHSGFKLCAENIDNVSDSIRPGYAQTIEIGPANQHCRSSVRHGL